MFNRRRLLTAAFVVALGALAAGTFYVCTKGFTRSWRALIAAEFEKQGIELSLRRLTLDPFRGLVAQEVKLLDARDRRRVFAVIDEMQLGVNYAGLARGESILEFVDLRDARVSLPLDAAHPDTTRIEISKLNARLFLPRQQLYLARAEAEVFGIQVYASGRLINPQAYRGRPIAQHPATRQRAAELIELLTSLRYKAEPPVLTVQFSGDLEHPSEIALDAWLDAESVKRGSYTLGHVSAVASYRAGVLELHQVVAADGKGELRGSATYQPRTGRISGRVQSGLALQDLARGYDLALLPPELELTAAPKLDLSLEGIIARPGDWNVFGRLELERFAYRAVPFRKLITDASWSGGRWSLRDLHLQHQSGEARGEAIVLPGEFRAKLQGSISPRAFSPWLHAAVSEWLGRFEFVDSPAIKLEFRGRAPTAEACAATGEIRFGRGLYEGAPAQNFTAQVRYAEGALSLSPFPRPAEDDAGEADLIFDLKTKEARLEKRHTGAVAPTSKHGGS